MKNRLDDQDDNLDYESERFRQHMQQWIDQQVVKSFWGFLVCFIKAAMGILTEDPAMVMEEFFEMIKLLNDLMEMLMNFIEYYLASHDFDTSFIDDMTLNGSTNFSIALQNAVDFHLKAHGFDDIILYADETIKRIDQETDFGIDGVDDLIIAMKQLANTGKDLVEEVV